MRVRFFSNHTIYYIGEALAVACVCVTEARGRRWNNGEQRKAAPHLLELCVLGTILLWHPGYVLKNVCSFWILFSKV